MMRGRLIGRYWRDYAAYLRDAVECGSLAISTAQNRLSSVNRTMAALRGDQCVKLPSPSKALGMQRTGIRQSAPQGQDREQVSTAGVAGW